MKRRGFLKGLVSLAVAAPAVGVGASGVVSRARQRPLCQADSVEMAGFGMAQVKVEGEPVVYDTEVNEWARPI